MSDQQAKAAAESIAARVATIRQLQDYINAVASKYEENRAFADALQTYGLSVADLSPYRGV